MGKRTPDWPSYPTWSTARYWSFIRSAIRSAHTKWPPAQNIMKKGRRIVTGKRHRFEHQCADCKEWFQQKEIERDHIIATGSLKTYSDLPGFVERMFVSEEGYRNLCKPCHRVRTNEERKK